MIRVSHLRSEVPHILYFLKANCGIINLSNDVQQTPHQPKRVTRTVGFVTPRF